MAMSPTSPTSPGPFTSRNTAPSLSTLRSGGLPAPIPVLVPSEGSNTIKGDAQTLRTPIPLVPSSFFVGVPGALGGEAEAYAAVDVDAVTHHIESHSSNVRLQSPPRLPRSRRPPPPPPTPSHAAVVETPVYHTETVPCTREANSTEISTILQAPSRLLGHKFTPSRGQEIWEAIEVSVGTTRAKADAATDDAHRPVVPLRLQTPEDMGGKKTGHPEPRHWAKEPEKMTDAFAVDSDDEDVKPVPHLVGTGEVVVRFRGYEGTGEEHYMLVRDFVDMLKDRSVLIVEVE